MDIQSLQSRCRGRVLTPKSPDFQKIVFDALWNKLVPARKPQAVVRVLCDQDVIEAIKFARSHGLKVAVRGGGHNWCSPSLRHGGMLIDLSELTKVISIDVEHRRAVVEPIISNRDIQRHLNPLGLAYPSGHCPQVKLSGYLLGGGMSWNQGSWGHGAGSVEAVELVTADGKLIKASEHEHQEYLWAARGAGSGFFGVAVRYHLRLHPLPQAIHGSTYYYPLESADKVAAWLGELAPTLPANIELSLFILSAPAEYSAQAPSGQLCMVTATIFTDSAEEAISELAVFDSSPLISDCIARLAPQPYVFDQLFDFSGALWPENHRNLVEATFSDADPATLVGSVTEHFRQSPSPTTLILFVFATGPREELPDAAFSMNAHIYGGPWTMWTDPAGDATNTAWHRRCVELMRPHTSGCYIGESDMITYPGDAKASFAPANWERLADLRQKHDPQGVFYNYHEGVNK